MKKIDTKKIRIIITSTFCFIFLIITSFIYIKRFKSSTTIDNNTPVTQPAPDVIMHYSPLEKKLTESRATFFIADNGDGLIKDEFENEFRISTDGNILKRENENFVEIKEEKEKKFVLDALEEATTLSGYAGILRDGIKEKNIIFENEDTKHEITETTSDSLMHTIINDGNSEKINEMLISEDKKKDNNLIDFEPYSIFKSLKNDYYEEVNNQKGKNEFINSFKENAKMYFLTENDIAPATIIPITIISGLNSDLPGEIIAQTSVNVYDNLTNDKLLIPKGSLLLAKYDSQITYGQNRILIAWTTLIRVDGLVVSLPGFQGVDNLGRSGYTGKVNNHISDIVKSAGLSSLIDIATLSASKLSDNDSLNTFLTAIANSTSESNKNIISKASNRQPTITIDVGKSAKVLVNKKLTLPDIRNI